MEVSIPEKGVLKGVILLDSQSGKVKCYRFSGVPYGLPPIGSRRWRKPEPLPQSFSYNLNNSPGLFTGRSSICPQPRVFGRQESTHNEDCLQSNIYVPLGEPPQGGWPVFFYIHGGFLQFGSNNFDDPSILISDTDVKCIIVSPAYRLGIFGFLSSRQICEHEIGSANFGFWDQRLALEWTYDNVEHFGGNRENITVGGLSAGSYASFHQLAYDIGPSSRRQIIRRVFQWSNGCGVQPKRLSEVQEQFEDLLSVLRIPSQWSSEQKLDALKAMHADQLIEAVGNMQQKFFRPILDGNFMSEDLFRDIFDGSFASRMRQLGIQTMIGDLTQEFHLYKNVYPPDSYKSLVDRLSWDYPRHIALEICARYKPSPTSKMKNSEEWKDVFGSLYADMQIHSTMRGFLQEIGSQLPISSIHRYRIDWRTQSVDKRLPREVGATHGTDMSIWFYGNGEELTDSEKDLVQRWLKPVGSFLRGEKVDWGTENLKQVRYLTAAGQIEVQDDDEWESKLSLWDLTKGATNLTPSQLKSRL